MSDADICERLSDEIDLCVNEGAGDIAGLLEDARWEILKLRNRVEASGIAELTEALRELRAEVQRLLLTTQADTKRADCPVMAVAKASAKAGNVLAQPVRKVGS